MSNSTVTRKNGNGGVPVKATDRKVFRPHADIYELADGFSIEIDLPGAREESVNLSLDSGVLSVHARKDEPQPGENYSLLHEGILSGDYERSFRLPDTVDYDRIEARYDSGVLTVSLPKQAQTAPRKIAVNKS